LEDLKNLPIKKIRARLTSVLASVKDAPTLVTKLAARISEEESDDEDEDNAANQAVKSGRYELLANNLKELLGDTRFADVALSTPTKTFIAHKAILSGT